MRLAPRLRGLALPLGLVLLLAGRGAAAQAPPAAPAGASPSSNAAAQARGPREQSVLDALKAYERAVLASDTVALKRLWAEDYTFINARGVLVTRAQRLANFRSGATDVVEALNQREITVRVNGDNAVVRQLFTLRGRFGGAETDSEVRCTFVWAWRAGRWQLVTNQLTPVLP